MAEIEIEKKKPVWPWILLVLIILAIIYFLVFDDDDPEPVEDLTEEVEEPTAFEDNSEDMTDWETEMMNDTLAYTGAGVSGFVTYIGDESRMGVDHEYTSTALLYLIDAVRDKADELSWDAENELTDIRERAKRITENPEATDHAGTIKDVGADIVDLMENMQEENFPDLEQEIEQTRMAVEAIDPSVATLEQKEAINSFFKEAADVLQKMEK